MLLRIHLEAIRMIGALEWRWPAHPTERVRDLETNYRRLVEWIAGGRLQVAPLLDRVASPADCQAVYEGLIGRTDGYLGAVFTGAGSDDRRRAARVRHCAHGPARAAVPHDR